MTSLSAKPSEESGFILPENIRYACQRDGMCCNGWEIRVEDEEAERILAVDWQSCVSDPAQKSPFAMDVYNKGERTLRRVGPPCVFLGEDLVCRLHASHGGEIKPRICQRFPFRFVETPGGLYVGLSFVCKSVQEEFGSDIREQAETVFEEYRRWPEPHQVAQTICLEAGSPITWEDYLAIEGALDEILAIPESSVAECLIAGHVWLGILRKVIRAANVLTGPMEPRSRLIAQYIEQTRAERYERAFRIAGKPAGNRAVRRMLLGTFIAFRNALIRKRWRGLVLAEVFGQNLRHWFRIGSLTLPPYEQHFSYRDFNPDPSDLTSPADQDLLRRYFRHALFRKDLIRHTDLHWGYCYAVLSHGLIQWYATALRAAGAPDAGRAVAMVERYFVHHSSFDQLFLYHPAMLYIVQYLFQRPNFAHTVLGSLAEK